MAWNVTRNVDPKVAAPGNAGYYYAVVRKDADGGWHGVALFTNVDDAEAFMVTRDASHEVVGPEWADA